MNRYENDIINIVCNYYDVKVYHVFSKIKNGEIPNARTVLIWVYNNYFKLEVSEISLIFGINKTSVAYHLRKYKYNESYYSGAISRLKINLKQNI